EVSMDNTITALKKGHIFQVLGRLLGAKVGACKVKTLSGKARKEYFAIPATERLTKNDIEQGTVTISNLGSVYKEQRGAVALLEIIPPQVSAFGVGAVQDKPVVITDSLGNKTIEIRQVLPICIAFDHRAFDFGEVVPFIKKLDFIFENPSIMHTWKGKEKTLMFSKDA
ncbi:MAG: 2-oxo acid dehydrogenase subunit E2, partial [Oscillospiraceae bacterium]